MLNVSGISNMMSTPAIQERLRVVGFTSEVGGPDDLTRTMREDMARNSELIKRTDQGTVKCFYPSDAAECTGH